MAVKLADTLAPMGDFPAAKSSNVEITLSGGAKKSIQEAYEDGDLGGGGNGVQAVDSMPALPDVDTVVLYVGETTVSYIKGHTYQAKALRNYWGPTTWDTQGVVFEPINAVWIDGDNIYYSFNNINLKLNKTENSWETKEWLGFTKLYGDRIWTDGVNYYFSNSASQYVLNKATSTWEVKEWTGLTSFSGKYVWTDGTHIYYSKTTEQYVLDVATSTWSPKTWQGLTDFYGANVWSDGTNIYHSRSSTNEQYVLDVATSTWSEKTWQGLTTFTGNYVWSDLDGSIYYSDTSEHKQYVLDKSTSTWSPISWSSLGPTEIDGRTIWSDGENTYNGSRYVLGNSITWIDITPAGGSTVDQNYDSTSPNAQSGTAVAQAIDQAINQILNASY